MSNKKFRTPASGAKVTASDAEKELKKLTDRADQLMADAHTLYRRMNADRPLNADQVREMSETVGCTMYQVVGIVSGVMATVDSAQLREIVGPGLKLPKVLRDTLKRLGDRDDAYLDRELTHEQQVVSQTAPAKRPRGSKHPLLALLETAVKAGKLYEKIMGGLFPRVFNKPTLIDKENAQMMKAVDAAFPV